MREFLFRGKLFDGTWSEGNVEIKPNDVFIITPDETVIGRYGRVIPETVGQYTNKKDVNGTKIFEYDIVQEGCNGLIGVVVWDNDLATYKLDGFGEGYTIQDAEIEWEVVGNKFDNPELLKGGEG